MSRLMISSDLHLGHKNIIKYREQFSTAEEHHETIFENLATTINKRDTLFLLGDIAFTLEWHQRIAEINCRHKVLLLGNHDTDRSVKIHQFAGFYDKVHGLLSHRNYWFSHCPMHPQELRNRLGNIHGHLHGNNVWIDGEAPKEDGFSELDTRYFNACVEHTDWKPISFKELTQQ